MTKKNENEKENLSFREKMKDKKYSAKVQLIGYGVFIIIVIIYANISSRNYDYNYANKVEPSKSESTTSGVIEDKKLLDVIDKNYEYQISIEIVNQNDNTSKYLYRGSRYEDILKIIPDNGNTFYLKNNEYYEEKDGVYQLISESDIYGDIENKYIDLEEILNYLKKATLDHTTNYSSGEIISTYYLYLKDILPNYYEEKYIEFNVTDKDNTLSISIDYSNLMNYKDNEIKNYKVEAIYNNIDKVEEFDINTNTSNVE